MSGRSTSTRPISAILLPLCGVKWVIGCEARSDTGESQAEGSAHPSVIQPFTVPIAIEWRPPGEDHRIAKARRTTTTCASAKASTASRRAATATSRAFSNPGQLSDTLFHYRQFIDPNNFNDGRGSGARRSTSAPNDYVEAAIPTSPALRRRRCAGRSKGPARRLDRLRVLSAERRAARTTADGRGYPNLMIDTAAFGHRRRHGRRSRTFRVTPFGEPRGARRSARHRRRDLRRGRAPRIFPTAAGSAGNCRRRPSRVLMPDGTAANAFQAQHSRTAVARGIKTAHRSKCPLGFHCVPTELNNFVAGCKEHPGATHLTRAPTAFIWPVDMGDRRSGRRCSRPSLQRRRTWPQARYVSDARRVTAYRNGGLLARGTADLLVGRRECSRNGGAGLHGDPAARRTRYVRQADGTTRNFDPNGDFPASQPTSDRRTAEPHLQLAVRFDDARSGGGP